MRSVDVPEVELIASTVGTGPPPQALLLLDFANTLDVDADADPPEALPDPTALAGWLRRHGLVSAEARAQQGDLDLARTLRSGLRAAMRQHHDQDHNAPIRELDAAAAALPLQLDFQGSRPLLAPATSGVRAGLARLLVAIADTHADGSWVRLKLCPVDDCQLAFYDSSKNRSRVWCSMGECGNRQKTRSYRARQRLKT